MQKNRHYISIAFILFLTGLQSVWAQPGFDLAIKKPPPYENREVKAEKSGRKKFTPPRRLMQNTTTHYNYFFNSNTKLNEIISRAKETHRDNYSQLLPFYNYSLEATTQDSALLDSVIYKTKTGILLHDLRNDWIDDLYLLWGAAFYFQQQYDSAYQMFQFINYAFADKEKDGYYKYIGSGMDGNNSGSISTEENRNLLKRLTSDPPSRNTAFIWQIRTLTQQNALPEAGSLITTLRNDPLFPQRLNGALEEVQAYWFYKQQRWDSAAAHLVNAFTEAGTKNERARWEYLAGQLFEQANLFEQAKEYYTKSIGHTADPVMDIYARLNLIRMNKEGGDEYIQRNIDDLVKMAKRDKYEEYRDVIYAMAARMELERGNIAAAQELFLKSSTYKNTESSVPGGSAFLQLADLSFASGKYLQAASFYDSVQLQSLAPGEAERISNRKQVLSRIVTYSNTINYQDSLQHIAGLPEDERKDILKKMVRQLRKQQGLKEEEVTTAAGGAVTSFPDPFQTNGSKGEWYFYNTNLKASGAATFKQLWGNRPNVDNWRRFSDVTAQLRTNVRNDTRGNSRGADNVSTVPTYDALLNSLPLTSQQMLLSNNAIQKALYGLGSVYINDLENYPLAIETYEALRSRFPQPDSVQKILFNLYYSYLKTGNAAKAAELKKLLQTNYPADRFTAIINTGKDPASTKPGTEVTKMYEGIYDLYLEGRFREAKEAKQKADSIYKTTYWQPQLLYIEAVYHIREREDSIAKNILNLLMSQNAGTPLAAKADNLLQVLSRRSKIEAELAGLQVTRPQEDSVARPVVLQKPVPQKPPVPDPKPPVSDSVVVQPDTLSVVQKRNAVASKPKNIVINKPAPVIKSIDTTFKKQAVPVKNASIFNYTPDAPHVVAVILNKVDVVFGNEARNAFNRYNQQTFYNQPFTYDLYNLNDSSKLLLISSFTNVMAAVDYVQKAKPVAATQIVPWLKSDKYTFSIISEANLAVLKENKNLVLYQKFLEQNLPVKF